MFNLPLIPEDEVTVRVLEVGTRPVIMTKARRDAPQAAATMGRILGQRRFAELNEVVLDWSNELNQQPAEIAKPVMFMACTRAFPGRGYLTVESRLDVDDIFGADVLTLSLLEDLANELGEKLSAMGNKED